MKIIALYLPQYHCIPENDQWWGENYTEWTSLKKGEKLIEGQYQPRIPLNKNYYNLLNPETVEWQVELAKKYGVYGFCTYHYWFNGRLLLEKPMENYLKRRDLALPYFFCWANNNWDTSWETSKNYKPKTLIIQNFNDPDDIKNHFDYMLPFFKDPRYMKEDNKPIFSIYNPLRIPINYLVKMKKNWNDWAIENGFSGIIFTYQWGAALTTMNRKMRNVFDYGFEYLPSLVDFVDTSCLFLKKRELVRKIANVMQKLFPNFVYRVQWQSSIPLKGVKVLKDYDEVWNRALLIKHKWENIVPGAFTDWDNTPRYKRNGKVITGSTPEKFQFYLEKQIKRAKLMGKDAIIVFAWNEWAEGGYLEPDEKYQYGYLEAIKKALIKTDELKDYRDHKRIFIEE